MTPFYGKQILFEIALEDSPSGVERFRYSLRSHPSLGEAAVDIAAPVALPSRDHLFAKLEALEQSLDAVKKQHPDYFVRRRVVAPASLEYGQILSLIGRLQEETGETWLGAATQEASDG